MYILQVTLAPFTNKRCFFSNHKGAFLLITYSFLQIKCFFPYWEAGVLTFYKPEGGVLLIIYLVYLTNQKAFFHIKRGRIELNNHFSIFFWHFWQTLHCPLPKKSHNVAGFLPKNSAPVWGGWGRGGDSVVSHVRDVQQSDRQTCR